MIILFHHILTKADSLHFVFLNRILFWYKTHLHLMVYLYFLLCILVFFNQSNHSLFNQILIIFLILLENREILRNIKLNCYKFESIGLGGVEPNHFRFRRSLSYPLDDRPIMYIYIIMGNIGFEPMTFCL